MSEEWERKRRQRAWERREREWERLRQMFERIKNDDDVKEEDGKFVGKVEEGLRMMTTEDGKNEKELVMGKKRRVYDALWCRKCGHLRSVHVSFGETMDLSTICVYSEIYVD